MGQQLQRWRTAGGEKLWFSMLIDTMEDVARSEPRSPPCDRSIVAAVCAQLSRPASAYAHRASGFDLRH